MSPGMKSFWRWASIVIAVLVVAVGAIVIFFDWNWLRGPIVRVDGKARRRIGVFARPLDRAGAIWRLLAAKRPRHDRMVYRRRTTRSFLGRKRRTEVGPREEQRGVWIASFPCHCLGPVRRPDRSGLAARRAGDPSVAVPTARLTPN